MIILFWEISVFEGAPRVPWGEYGQLFEKIENLCKWLKHIWFNSEFDADFKYDTSFQMNSLFLDEDTLASSQKTIKIMKKSLFLDPCDLH